MMHNAIAHHPPTNTQPAQAAIPYPHFPVPILDVTSHGMEYTIGSLGQVPWLCPVPTSCAPPAFSLAGHEKLKNP